MVDRRKLLKGMGTTAGSGLLGRNLGNIAASIIDKNNIRLGQSKFIEMVLEHPDLPEYPISQSMNTADYIVEDGLYVTTGSLETFTSSIIANVGRHQFTNLDTITLQESRRLVIKESDYRNLTATYVMLEEPYNLPAIELSFNNDKIIVRSDGGEIGLNPKQEEEMRLREREIVISKETDSERQPEEEAETISVSTQPLLRLRYHGDLSVYGHENGLVFPTNPTDKYAKARLSSLRADGANIFEESIGSLGNADEAILVMEES